MDWVTNLPIKRKLTLIILVTCSAVLLLACTALAVYELLDFRSATVRDATVLADILGENTQAALTFDDADAARKVLGALQAEPGVIAARVFGASNQPFADFVRSGSAPQLPLAVAHSGNQFAVGALEIYRPIVLDGKTIGTIYLRTDLRRMYDRLKLFSGIALIVLAVSLALAFALSSRLQRPISEPILALAEIARAVAEKKDYSVRAPTHGGTGELAMLTDAFNHMLAQIARRADELAATNAELEQFAYVASHDLKEPLRMVTQYMGLIERQLGANLSDQHRRFLHFAVDGATRMQTLINDLMSFTRTSHVQENHLPVDLTQVVNEVLATFQERISETRATMRIGELPTISGERTKLALVFQNLIGNALKFHAKDRDPVIDVTSKRIGSDWVISIADNGIGIDPAYRQQIFAVFQRLHGRDEYPGNGMGLAICRKIVDQHHGELWVESRAAGGSVFMLRIPCDPTPAAAQPVLPDAAPVAGLRLAQPS